MAAAAHCAPQTRLPADTSSLECASPLARDRRQYGEAPHRLLAKASQPPEIQTAFQHCPRSPLESFPWFDQTACGYVRRRPTEHELLRRLARGVLQVSSA